VCERDSVQAQGMPHSVCVVPKSTIRSAIKFISNAVAGSPALHVSRSSRAPFRRMGSRAKSSGQLFHGCLKFGCWLGAAV
jgi:hypothetical protein